MVVAPGARRYDDRGFLITASPACTSAPVAAAGQSAPKLVRAEANSVASASASPSPTMVGSAASVGFGNGLMALAIVVGGVATWL